MRKQLPTYKTAPLFLYKRIKLATCSLAESGYEKIQSDDNNYVIYFCDFTM